VAELHIKLPVKTHFHRWLPPDFLSDRFRHRDRKPTITNAFETELIQVHRWHYKKP